MQELNKKKKKSVLFCANCLHCKLIHSLNRDKSTYTKKIRCKKSRWKYVSKEEKIYDYHTILNRNASNCPYYESASDNDFETKQFIRHLKKTLPPKRIIYKAADNFQE